MTYFVVDVESDGPVPPLYSMVSFGAVRLDESLGTNFIARLKPISDEWMSERLKVVGYTRGETLLFPDPVKAIKDFVLWVKTYTKPGDRAVLVSDNNGFDYGFMSYYLWRYAGENPFGHSSHNMSDLYKGMEHTMKASFRHLVKTPHTHDPLDDAKGNAEALLAMRSLGLKIKF